MSDEEANVWFHTFAMGVYAFPVLGAILADAVWGKYRTILSLSIVYCLGHAVLALAETSIGTAVVEPRTGFAIGLGLIALGSGGIKPCAVGERRGTQFGRGNKHLIERVFQWFYFAINFGSAISTLLTPWLLAEFGPSVAFGVPGLLMFVATVVFWMGRKVFVHIPAGGRDFLKEVFSATGLKTLGKLAIIYVFVAVFWALFDQTASSWVLQAERMDRNLFGFELLSSQLQAANPILVLLFIPIFGYVIYPFIGRFFRLTAMRKIAIGLFVTVPAFVIPAHVETLIDRGEFPTIGWQVLAYIVMTAAEVMVSISALEFSYTQAPKRMKSFVMATFFLSITLGNLVTASTNYFIQNPRPRFAPDVAGSYTVELTVSDGTQTALDSVTIEVTEHPRAPRVTTSAEAPLRAEAGQEAAVPAGSSVRLYADADKGNIEGAVSYAWRFVSKPSASRLSDADIRDGGTRNPRFTPDVEGEYNLEFRYRVGRELRDRPGPRVRDHSEPAPGWPVPPPRRRAPSPSSPKGRRSSSGSASPRPSSSSISRAAPSYDPNGDALEFRWRVVDAPVGSRFTDAQATIEGARFATATRPNSPVRPYFLFLRRLDAGHRVPVPPGRFLLPREVLHPRRGRNLSQ